MVKTMGSIDKVSERRPRSDRGKKRPKYRGEPCKYRKPKYYVKKKRKEDKEFIQIWCWERIPMSKDGYKNWNKTPWLKPKLWKEVTNMKTGGYKPVHISRIDSKEKVEQYVADTYWDGKFCVMTLSHGKTKTGRKNVHTCTVVVRTDSEGYRYGKMTKDIRLAKGRYKWFYKG